ncbi:GLPGLI family protein [Kaistella palustris]|uniref:GLPGLI family protein n=1 Tax=Kaistella palustris TaxID=493376 RepID=UPI00040043CB|nr:GLPGLI family protein [Kaistella palustris]
MKKISLLLFALFAQMTFSQANRFVYQVTMKPDSTNRSTIKTETAFLDISDGNSVFYPENRLKRDSLFSRMRQTGNFTFDRSQMQNLQTNLDFTITKEYATQKKTYKARIGRDQYAYDEDREMTWNILPETEKIGDYKTQKAETQFGGRKWLAWFTPEIPIPDGPYKFSGLPGLIVKVEDTAGDYSFDLKEAKKIPAPAAFNERGQTITVKRAAFLKQQEQFRKDPASAFSGPGRGGRMQTDPAQRKQLTDRLKEQARGNNNPIELE